MALVELNQAADGLLLTIDGRTVAFRPDRLTVRRQESNTRGGGPVQRYLSITVMLEDEFPETTDHVT